jgi:hypothetical protein
MIRKTAAMWISAALCSFIFAIAPAAAGTLVGLSGWYGGGDFTVYQAGGFVAFANNRMVTSVEFLGGTVDFGRDETTNRVDLNLASSLNLVQNRDLVLSVFAGYKWQSFETDIDFSGYGPSLGATLSFSQISMSYALVRTTGGEFDNELIQIPTVSFRVASRSAPFGLMVGYRGEIMEDVAVHGGFVRVYMVMGR